MTDKTFRLVCRAERRLDRLIQMEQSHCGHDHLVKAAQKQKMRLLYFLEKEIEALVLKSDPSSPEWNGK